MSKLRRKLRGSARNSENRRDAGLSREREGRERLESVLRRWLWRPESGKVGRDRLRMR